MRAGLFFALYAVGALVLQTTVLPVVTVGRATPDLLLIFCVYLGLHQHTVGGAFGAFVLGYLEDTFSGNLIGLNAFAMSLVFLVVYLTSRRLWVDNTVSRIVVVFLASMVKTAVVVTLLVVLLSPENLWRAVIRPLLVEAVLAAVVSPAVFAILAHTGVLAAEPEA